MWRQKISGSKCLARLTKSVKSGLKWETLSICHLKRDEDVPSQPPVSVFSHTHEHLHMCAHTHANICMHITHTTHTQGERERGGWGDKTMNMFLNRNAIQFIFHIHPLRVKVRDWSPLTYRSNLVCLGYLKCLQCSLKLAVLVIGYVWVWRGRRGRVTLRSNSGDVLSLLKCRSYQPSLQTLEYKNHLNYFIQMLRQTLKIILSKPLHYSNSHITLNSKQS